MILELLWNFFVLVIFGGFFVFILYEHLQEKRAGKAETFGPSFALDISSFQAFWAFMSRYNRLLLVTCLALLLVNVCIPAFCFPAIAQRIGEFNLHPRITAFLEFEGILHRLYYLPVIGLFAAVIAKEFLIKSTGTRALINAALVLLGFVVTVILLNVLLHPIVFRDAIVTR